MSHASGFTNDNDQENDSHAVEDDIIKASNNGESGSMNVGLPQTSDISDQASMSKQCDEEHDDSRDLKDSASNTHTDDTEDVIGVQDLAQDGYDRNTIAIKSNVDINENNISNNYSNINNNEDNDNATSNLSMNNPGTVYQNNNNTSPATSPAVLPISPVRGSADDGQRPGRTAWSSNRYLWDPPGEGSETSSVVGERSRDPDSRRSWSECATDTEGQNPGGYRRRRTSSIRRRKPSWPAVLHSVSRRSSFGSNSSLVEQRKAESEPGDRGDDLGVIDEFTSSGSGSGSVSLRSMTRQEKFTVVNFCLTNFCVGAFYSLLAPFFSTEAYKKGVTPTVVGLIFASFEMTLFITAPIFGTFMNAIGAKFMYIAGVFVCGTGAILFGFLDGCPDGTIYIVMCFLVRFVEALGASAFSTASFAIMANTFPNNVASMFGSLELFSGLGLMIGPPIGGALFELGGFKLPFVSLGSLVVVVALLSIFLLPEQNVTPTVNEGSALTLLKIPIIPIVGFCLFCGSGSLGFFDVTLADFLTKTFNLTPVIIGIVFLVGPGVYAITAPVWGWVSDKFPQYNRFLICIGYTISGLAMFFVGPAPFFHIPPMLWLPIFSMTLVGFGVATLVIAFPVIADAAMSSGLPDNLSTYGLIAGVFNSFFSLGACMGPLGGGYLHESLKFETACVVVGSLELYAALQLFVFVMVSKYCCKSLDKTLDLSEEEIKNKNESADSEETPLLSSGVTAQHRSSNGRSSYISDVDETSLDQNQAVKTGHENSRLFYRTSQ